MRQPECNRCLRHALNRPHLRPSSPTAPSLLNRLNAKSAGRTHTSSDVSRTPTFRTPKSKRSNALSAAIKWNGRQMAEQRSFQQQWFLWAWQMQSEMMETVMRSREAIASSREILAKFDQCAGAPLTQGDGLLAPLARKGTGRRSDKGSVFHKRPPTELA
jgi:hypothetical protein